MGKGIEGIGAIENLAVPGEEPVANCLVGGGFELPVDFVDPGAVVGGKELLGGFAVAGAGFQVVGSAADESERPNAAGMAGGVGEGEHGAPGMPDDRGGLGGDGGEVVDVLLDGERGGAGAAL